MYDNRIIARMYATVQYRSPGRLVISNIRDALLHIEEAIDALTLEAEVREIGETEFRPIDPLQATIADELERIEVALGARGVSMLSPLAHEIRRAVIALVAARQALAGTGGRS
jgi:hypothetical protein